MKMKKNVWVSACALGIFLGAWHYAAAQETPLEIQQALDEVEKSNVVAVEPSSQGAVPAQPDVSAELVDTVQQSSDGSSENFVIKGNSLILDVLELKDMDINDVLKLLSKKSGLNIISGKNVAGKVTIYLKNVDVRDALRIILESNDLAYVEENGIIKVIPGQQFETLYGYKFGQDLETKIIQLKHAKAEDVVAVLNQIKGQSGKISSDGISNTLIVVDRLDRVILMQEMISRMDIPVQTKVFDLKYAKAEDVVKKVETLLSKNIGKIEFDTRSNKLFVTDTNEKIKAIDKMVQAFDQRHPEVLIEAKIVQVTLSDQYKMGIDWEAIVSDFHNLDIKSSFDILPSTGNRGKLGIGTIGSDDYQVLIEALDVVGTTNILSNPRITVINNEEAKILVGSNKPYVTTQTTTPASGPATTAETVNFIEVGVKLFVTPMIHGDGYITMKIRPEVSSAAKSLVTSTNNEIPIVETSQAETTVMVKDNATVVIGGLIKEEDSKTINKVPLLGDLPFLGVIFRNENKTKEKTEIVIFLTPKIVSGDSLLEKKPSEENIKK
ncbi:MAG: secretin N-terminal domain-containing protein [Oscillospiraceae bacterium]